MSLIKEIKASKTMRVATAQEWLGYLTILSSNMTYFEGSMAPAIFGGIMVVLGWTMKYLRRVTTQPLAEKVKQVN